MFSLQRILMENKTVFLQQASLTTLPTPALFFLGLEGRQAEKSLGQGKKEHSTILLQ